MRSTEYDLIFMMCYVMSLIFAQLCIDLLEYSMILLGLVVFARIADLKFGILIIIN